MSLLHRCVQDQDYDRGALFKECPVTLTPFVSVTDVSNRKVPASEAPDGLTLLSEVRDGMGPAEALPSGMVPPMAVSCPLRFVSLVESEEVHLKEFSLQDIPIGVVPIVNSKGETPPDLVPMKDVLAEVVPGVQMFCGQASEMEEAAGLVPVIEEAACVVHGMEEAGCRVTVEEPAGLAPVKEDPAGLVVVLQESIGLDPVKQEPAGLAPEKEGRMVLAPLMESAVFTHVTREHAGCPTMMEEYTGLGHVMQGTAGLAPVVQRPAGLVPLPEESAGLVPVVEEDDAGMVPVREKIAHLVPVFGNPAGLVHVVERSAGLFPLAEEPSVQFPIEEELTGLVLVTEKPSSDVPVTEKPAGLILMAEVPSVLVHVGEEPACLVPVGEESSCMLHVEDKAAGLVPEGEKLVPVVNVAEATTFLAPVAEKPDDLVTVKELLAGIGLGTDTCVSGMLVFGEGGDSWPYTAAMLAWNAANAIQTPPWTSKKDSSDFPFFAQSQESSFWTGDQSRTVPVQSLNGMRRVIKHGVVRTFPYAVCEGHHDGRMKTYIKNADNSPLVRQNAELLCTLQELEHRCSTLKEENNLLRKSSFPETDEKVKRLKKKNAELAVIAKRLEERAQKLQEANLKVVNTTVLPKGSGIEVCKKTFARQRARDLAEQASALLTKDKQIEALQQECRELKAKLAVGKECTNWMNLSDFDRLLRESQKEVLRLQRQIAIKYLKESLHLSKVESHGSSPSAINCLGSSEGVHIVDTSAPFGEVRAETAVTSDKASSSIDAKEIELSKKRKECENLEQEVRKKQKRCEELETILKEVKSENAKLLEENSHLNGRAAWTDKVEFENAGLRAQLEEVTGQRDSAIQENQQLRIKLENLEQVLKHMREVAERRQQLEKEHEDALIALRGRQEEVKRLHQAHVEAKKEHEGAVHLLENTLDCMQARVKDLEEKCLSQTKQFSLLSQELERFRLHTGKIDLFHSTLVTSELPITSCCSSQEPHHGQQEEDGPMSSIPCEAENIKDGVLEMEGLHQPEDALCNISKYAIDKSSATNEKELKKLETLPSSPKSSSHNSSKSCPTPEVDTASEMEELDVDSVSLIPEPESRAPAKLQVFLARYSYNPFDGPNENPEAELPLTAGEYIYIYGEMDDDGFYEGELMDGRRGLVPSNFVERVSDDDLMTFQPPEVSELSHSSYPDISFMSSSSMERSDIPEEEDVGRSSLLCGLQRSSEESTDVLAVPYPRKLTLIKQLARSIVVGWEPPLVPAGCGSIQSYNIYLDTELRQNVRCGSPTKALLEKLDLKIKAYRVSVQSVTENGNSDRLRCTLLVGNGYSIAPSHLRVRSLTATSAEVSWQPSNSNYTHVMYLNEEECGLTKAGTYWYAFRNLMPSMQYNVKVECRPHRTPWELPPERRECKSTVMQFTTPSAGPPDAPLDVQVEIGPSPGILNISWLPVTIDAAGTSNGVRVTGYAVYADGQKVLEVTSPTAGSVLLGMSHLQLLQESREVSVRTMSPHGESVDSVPAQVPSALLKVPDSLFVLNGSLVSEPPFGEYLDSQSGRITRTRLTSSPYSPETVPTSSSNAKLISHTISNELEFGEHTPQPESPLGDSGSLDSMPVKVSQDHLDSTLSAFAGHLQQATSQAEQFLGTNASKEHLQGRPHIFTQTTAYNPPPILAFPPKLCEVSAIPRMAALEERDCNLPEKNLQELPLITCSETNCQTGPSDFEVKIKASQAWTTETLAKGGVANPHARHTEEKSPETALSEFVGHHGNKAVYRGGSLQEFLDLSSEQRVDAEDTSLTWPVDEAEERDWSNKGGGLFASPANRSSDLSDILEEEEEDLHAEVPTGKKFGQSDHGNIRESGGKLDSCETDSDEEILERILVLPLRKHCSKKLFSIPEVTEEEDDEEESFASQDIMAHLRCNMERQKYCKTEKVSFLSIQYADPKSVLDDLDRNFLSEMTGDEPLHNIDNLYPDAQTIPEQNRRLRKSGWVCDPQEHSITHTSAGSPLWNKKNECNNQEQLLGRCEVARKCQKNVKEHCSRVLSNCNQLGSNMRKTHNLNERVTAGTCGGVMDDIDIVKGRQCTPHKSCHRLHSSCLTKPPTFKATSSFYTKGLEIDIEHDTEDDDGLTITAACVIQQQSNCTERGLQEDHEDWSDCSSLSELTQSRQKRKELKRQETLEEEAAGCQRPAPVVPSRWSEVAQSEKEYCSTKGVLEDQVWSLAHKKIISKERYEQREKDIPDATIHSRVCTSQNEIQRLQPSVGPKVRQGSTRKMKTIQPTIYSDQAPDDLKDLTSEGLKSATLDLMKDMNLDGTNTRILEEVKSSKKSLRDDSVRLFVALFDYDPSTMSPNPDAVYDELPFKEGQIIKVFGDKDADGFYKGECNGKTGYIPYNMVSEVQQLENDEVGDQLLHCGFLEDKTSMEQLEPNLQVCTTEVNVPRTMVATFDYNPQESSPNLDVEAELPFSAGDKITVYGSMDEDGFYYGELNGRRGLVPSNFVEEEVNGIPSDAMDAHRVRKERQLSLDTSGELIQSSPDSPECPSLSTPEQVEMLDINTRSKKKKGLFFKGRKLFKKLSSSKKD